MTWNSAKSDAEKRLPDLIKSARADRVRLVDFDSEETYYFLKEGEPQRSALSYHRMVNNALKRLLSRQKIKVDLVTITRAYYSLWLKEHTLTDSLENRTRFLREIL